ncbi:MAG: RNA polymerase sigma-70 factor ECF subfamily [Hyphomonadaceae bacterium]|nr:MAG: RNA polymerase sigma-70 factor ECF subfamily [Hyphomonadaceae bacterium]KAF0184899.1 MAG: RNA polymerase sigma-70 factor ECF subfamily [Hyphomonadaceae bacterium]
MTQIRQDKWDDWINESLAGNQASYRLLLCDLRIWLGAFFAKRVYQEGVEDLVQETLLAVHAKRATYDPSRSFGAWVNAVARHKWIDKIRANVKYVMVELDEEQADDNAVQANCAKYDVQKLLSQIPKNQADIISLVKLQEMTIEEAAQKTGLSQSYIKVTVHRGLKKLQAIALEGAL